MGIIVKVHMMVVSICHECSFTGRKSRRSFIEGYGWHMVKTAKRSSS